MKKLVLFTVLFLAGCSGVRFGPFNKAYSNGLNALAAKTCGAVPDDQLDELLVENASFWSALYDESKKPFGSVYLSPSYSVIVAREVADNSVDAAEAQAGKLPVDYMRQIKDHQCQFARKIISARDGEKE